MHDSQSDNNKHFSVYHVPHIFVSALYLNYQFSQQYPQIGIIIPLLETGKLSLRVVKQFSQTLLVTNGERLWDLNLETGLLNTVRMIMHKSPSDKLLV